MVDYINATRQISLSRYISIFLIIFFCVLLSSCSNMGRKDGPPNFYIDANKIPNAVPKPEPKAKYGNMTSYRVFGKRYYTLKSSKNYNQVGIASWYGTKFHAQRTSSGEPYNMLAMTAAHKTLPLPTYVEVTNLKNDRKIIVKVNDRGPFASNRIIDLSYVAAKKLGMIGRGTTHVRVKAIDPHGYQPSMFLAKNTRSEDRVNRFVFAENRRVIPFKNNAVNQPLKQIYLHVGTFSNKTHALRLKQRLLTMLKAPISISPIAHRQNQFYRVKIGPFKNSLIANKVSLRLKNLGLKPNKIYGV
ncbi:MAG: hypothetical protein ACD_46C00268G0006 [uncultured bacterium]|nr:MAG: hypothetical protein ACD_46C00268G0006 [uncultured bacterium]